MSTSDKPDGGLSKFSNGEVYFWIEQESSIMLKAVSSFGDPVELTGEDAKEIATALLAAARKLEAL